MKVKYYPLKNEIVFTFMEKTLESKTRAICNTDSTALKSMLRKKPKKVIVQIIRGMSEKRAKRHNSPFTYVSKEKYGEQLTYFQSSGRITPPNFNFSHKNFTDWLCEEVEIDSEEIEERYFPDDDELEGLQWYENPLNIKWISLKFFY